MILECPMLMRQKEKKLNFLTGWFISYQPVYVEFQKYQKKTSNFRLLGLKLTKDSPLFIYDMDTPCILSTDMKPTSWKAD